MHIANTFGRENMVLFGMKYQDIKQFKATKPPAQIAKLIGQEFKDTVAVLKGGEVFGPCDPVIIELLTGIQQGYDPYMIGVGFKDYIAAQEEADRVFSNKKEFCKRIVMTFSNLGKL